MSILEEKRFFRRLTAYALTILALMIGLSITSYAISTISVSEKDNYFQTGSVGVNLNDGKAVITEDEFKFEPGMTVVKDFFIQNLSTDDVYFKLYFTDVKGVLATVLQITISDGDTVLARGTAAELTREAVEVADDVLRLNERRVLTITFHYPEGAGNATQSNSLSFALCAEVVQTKNNADKNFA